MWPHSAKTLPGVNYLFLFLILLAFRSYAQSVANSEFAAVGGIVRDSLNHPIAAAQVFLEAAESRNELVSTTDHEGHYHFDAVPPANYVLRVTAKDYQEKAEGPLVLHAKETKTCSLVLTEKVAATKDASSTVQFSDEPEFTIAGLTDVTEYGSHGSARFVNNRDALSKQAVSLGLESGGENYDGIAEASSREASIRAMLAKEDNGDLRAELADIEEREGKSLEAVQDYQRAAELQPTEAHQFAWGAELLLHRAYEPAILVFQQGRRTYPHSVRMLLGLGAATYANGTEEAAERVLVEACDLDPTDPTPYLFLGRLQSLEDIDVDVWVDRMKRFARLHPENAMAHSLYGMAMKRQVEGQTNWHAIESQLRMAIQLDPHLGEAYLQLGILYSERGDFADAAASLKKAVESVSIAEQAHYWLAQVYRQSGETEKAHEEIEQFKRISEQKEKETEREHHEIRQFVYTLRNQNSPAPAIPVNSP